ncbi:MAG: rRNA maturation RNase YbeY [Candidatus Dormibacterales bacterium]
MAEPVRLEVEVFNAVRAPTTPGFVRNVIARAAALPEVGVRLPRGSVAIAVRLTGEAELRRLNQRYAGKDSTTDVLSFVGDSDHLGDLAIAWPRVLKQAERYGHPARAELALLCVHGLLHLLGWDHAGARERAEMSRLTLAALGRAGIEIAPGRL